MITFICLLLATIQSASMIPEFVKIRNNLKEPVNVKLTLRDSIGICDVPKYDIPSKENSSKPVPLSCFPLKRVDVVLSGGGGCHYTPSPGDPLVSLEINSKDDGNRCEIVPVEGLFFQSLFFHAK